MANGTDSNINTLQVFTRHLKLHEGWTLRNSLLAACQLRRRKTSRLTLNGKRNCLGNSNRRLVTPTADPGFGERR